MSRQRWDLQKPLKCSQSRDLEGIQWILWIHTDAASGPPVRHSPVSCQNNFALRGPKAIHLLPGEHGEIWARLEVRWEKSGVLEHKSCNISEMRGDRGNITIEGLQELTNALLNGTIPDSLWRPLPQDWGFTTHTQNFNHCCLRNGWSYGIQIWPVHSQGPSKQNPIKNLGEKGAWAYPGTAQIFGVPTIISGMGKATLFKFCMHIHRIDRNKSPLGISGK